MAYLEMALPVGHPMVVDGEIELRVAHTDGQGRVRSAVRGTEFRLAPGDVVEVDDAVAEAILTALSDTVGVNMLRVAAAPESVRWNLGDLFSRAAGPRQK